MNKIITILFYVLSICLMLTPVIFMISGHENQNSEFELFVLGLLFFIIGNTNEA